MNIDITKALEGVRRGRILHIGANTGQELNTYEMLGFFNTAWVEMDSGKIAALENKCGLHNVYNYAIGERFGWVTSFYSASNNNESASLLKPHKHIYKYIDIKFSEEMVSVQGITIDFLIWDKLSRNPNVLILDIQGNELNALKGLGRYKDSFDVIITEAYTEELYEGCGMLDDIKQLLSEHYDFIEYAPEGDKGWGDALFKLKKQP